MSALKLKAVVGTTIFGDDAAAWMDPTSAAWMPDMVSLSVWGQQLFGQLAMPALPLGSSSQAVAAIAHVPAQVDTSDVFLVDLTESIAAVGGSALKVSGGGSGSGGGIVTSYTSGAPGAYNISITFKGTWTASLQNVFKAAADRLSGIIIGDVKDVRINGKIIDDISISAELSTIDGVGGVLGQAGPTLLRTGSYLPAAATMQFDSADAQNYYNAGLFDEIVTHEMLHSVGFGSIWSFVGLTSGSSYIGANAVSEYNKLVGGFAAGHGGSTTLANGITLAMGAVPLETGGGSGTAGAHWSEAVFANELMTGYLNLPVSGSTAPADPLSMMSAASMRDLGYVTAAIPPVDIYVLI